MTTRILYLLLFLCFIGCQPKKKQIVETTTCCVHSIESDALHKQITQGNIKAYELVKELYKQKGELYEVIFYSMMMANKYHYTQAYMDVYLCFWHAFNDDDKNAAIYDLSRFDPKSGQMAMFYLKEAAKRGNQQAKDILKKQYIR
ncbi:hypothetical protein [Paludibacter sp.]|uniref:hypothetical protein n=1 Tax=Paludibacter sp. TaxID=1898105 RepID=UPI0013530ACD|nr:hypothetical protein [Paludibacter sp.]MTK53910.1 hypothetical protein [Paludibacter sp.]